jgi:hypothetical protein
MSNAKRGSDEPPIPIHAIYMAEKLSIVFLI